MSENNSAQKLNFELPPRECYPAGHPSKLILFLLVCILIAVGLNTIMTFNQSGFSLPFQNKKMPDSGSLKQLALKLEKQGLFNVAAGAWKQYLESADLDAEETAMIWYRIGKLYQDNHLFENALDGYYRSENTASVDSIAPEIAIRIQECLESMGRFSAMQHELAGRVGINNTGDHPETNNAIVAEIGTRKISAAELDRHMEKSIEQQMTLMAPFLPVDERNKQKEILLRQFSSPANRMSYINQMVAEEVLYRNARENKLADKPEIRDLINDQEKSLLARMVLQNAYSDKINITLTDLETYFEANKDAFAKEGNAAVFEDVKNDVYKALRTRKEQEIQQQLLSQLKTQYDVVIHQSAIVSENSSKNEGPEKNIN